MSEHLYGKNIEVYFRGDEKERMKGKLVGSADGVIVLEYNDGRLHKCGKGRCSLGGMICQLFCRHSLFSVVAF